MGARSRSRPDARGYRALLGVVGPSTNTVVQPDFDDMRPFGVTNHYSRIAVDDAKAVSDDSFTAATHLISDATLAAVAQVGSCNPDYLVMGMSAVTFYGGAQGAADWKQRVEDASGLRLCTGSQALIDAFAAYGGVRKIAVVSPYFPSANSQVGRFMADYGVEMVRDSCMRCPSWTSIAQVTEGELRDELRRLDGDDIDALVQVGTNLSAVGLAAAAERWLGKPVIAINAATYWKALRDNGITDRMAGFGRLFEEF